MVFPPLESSDHFETTYDEESGDPVELEVINFNEGIWGQNRAICIVVAAFSLQEIVNE